MDRIKIGKLIGLVICLVIFSYAVNCYGANEKANENFKQGEEDSSAKNLDKAIADYTKAIKKNPKLVKAYNNRGIAYTKKTKFYLALADFNKAIELDPKDGKSYNNRAIVHMYLGDYNRVRQDIHKAQSLGVKVDPNFLKKVETLPDVLPPIFHKPVRTQIKPPKKGNN